MSSFEYEGKNVAKAVKKACEDLNLARDEINYEVCSYGSNGIFGFVGAKKARILVTLPEKKPDAEIESVGPDAENSNDSMARQDLSLNVGDSGESRLYQFADNPIDLSRSVLQRIVDSITAGAEVTAEKKSKRIFLKVAGGNAAVLIGKKGQTLEAMQSLVEKIVNKHNNTNNGHKVRIQVDVEGYLETRRTNLEKLAIRLADKSRRIGKPISLGQMSAYDRRIVHMVLKDDHGIHTKSRGEGYMRKLVIFPKKNNPQRQQLH
jgi:spoIIIJ-associated protein